MDQNDREGQGIGRTTGASGEDAEEQQQRTIEGQESQPGKAWQESDKGQFGGQSGSDEPNEQADESQWQGNRFSQGGSIGNDPTGGSNS